MAGFFVCFWQELATLQHHPSGNLGSEKCINWFSKFSAFGRCKSQSPSPPSALGQYQGNVKYQWKNLEVRNK